ncbi:MAG: nitronate monooxygenase family protein, partial [Sinobacteraceae bacterium]|nr:nitronate monooxygenase family protein [Nevskiaceae bacterium]
AGIVGAFPSLNARPAQELEVWLNRIREALDAWDAAHPETPAAPFAVNLIVHKSNNRLMHDLELCVKHEVPMVISSLGARTEVNDTIHSYGGVVLHDVINQRFAHKAIDKGADGLIAVAAGAGGHAGTLSPFAFVQEIRAWFDGPLALSGCIANGRSIAAALAMGADVAYMGSPFIATEEANAVAGYKQEILDSVADEIVYTPYFSGVHGNYLGRSVTRAGYDIDNLPAADASKMDFGSGEKDGSEIKAWRDIWSAGQGVGVIDRVQPAGDFVAQLGEEFRQALARSAA